MTILKKDKRKRKHHWPASLVSSFPLVTTNMILIEELWTVQSYIELFIDGCPKRMRPMVCPHCLAEVMLHKHGSFKRTVYFLSDTAIVPFFRFKCPIDTCNKTTSLLPNFAFEHNQVAWEVKEEVIRQQLSGVAMAKISEDLKTLAGTFSEKTLWRWSKAILGDLRDLSSELWQVILEKLPHVEIPVGPSKLAQECTWLFKSWAHVRSLIPKYMSKGLLNLLYQIKYSRAVAAG